MAPGGEGKGNPGGGGGAGAKGGGRKRKFLPHGKPVRKGAYPLRPGVQGFFITCDGGRERQATREALSLLDSVSNSLRLLRFTMLGPWLACSGLPFLGPCAGDARTPGVRRIAHDSAVRLVEGTFYEDLVDGKGSDEKPKGIPDKPLNKKIKFEDSDSSDDEDEDNSGDEADNGNGNDVEKGENAPAKQEQEVLNTSVPASKDVEEQAGTAEEPKEKKQRVEDPPRLFASLDSGCNGCIFIQMHKRAGDPGPVEIVQNMMSSAASTRKHMSRFILRVLPAEVACYASEEEITKAISPLVEKYFPKECPSVHKFAVLYEARSNTGIDRMKIVNAVAKSVPQPHKVDLKNPDKTIIVQIAKDASLILFEYWKYFLEIPSCIRLFGATSSPSLMASPWQRLPTASAAMATHALSTLAGVKCVGARPSCSIPSYIASASPGDSNRATAAMTVF
ncbi:uncharacterized protein C2845_PM02G36630 [Panicum miliaceum]|uniref:THUMP domain-containing protein n=1 Tax=Panicum miliaceum TaxID=4540 RepID=A0A3L6S641_PANMI|nr:uncharacterized protein C2845_PM02G36630 [Panicum miliaceum]